MSSGSDSEEDIAASKRSRRRTQLVVNSDSDDQEGVLITHTKAVWLISHVMYTDHID